MPRCRAAEAVHKTTDQEWIPQRSGFRVLKGSSAIRQPPITRSKLAGLQASGNEHRESTAQATTR